MGKNGIEKRKGSQTKNNSLQKYSCITHIRYNQIHNIVCNEKNRATGSITQYEVKYR